MRLASKDAESRIAGRGLVASLEWQPIRPAEIVPDISASATCYARSTAEFGQQMTVSGDFGLLRFTFKAMMYASVNERYKMG
jgi:hypothetical protein